MRFSTYIDSGKKLFRFCGSLIKIINPGIELILNVSIMFKGKKVVTDRKFFFIF